MTKWVYDFSEGNAEMRNLLGDKGVNLAEMTNLGIPIPKGFTITTEACKQYWLDKKGVNKEIKNQINEYIIKLEKETQKKFGDRENPLLVSVRNSSCIAVSGMMKTISNIGLNEEIVNSIAKKLNNPYYAWDNYKRFIEDYATIIMRLPKENFEKIVDMIKKRKKTC